jgi:ubiquitin-protein ligase
MTMTTKLSEEHLLALDNISHKSIKKRITRELEKLDRECSLISVEDDLNDKDKNGFLMPIINILDNTNNLIYSITLNNYYPFRPPKVQINFRPYYEFLRISFSPFSENLKKIHKINCLCCSTITCGDNWTPAFTTNHLITEIRNFKGYRRNLINKLLADKIKVKYLIADINLDCWLF